MRYQLQEVAQLCQVSEHCIERFIAYAWIRPASEEWLDAEDLARIRLIVELQNEFGVNDDAVPIILHLVDQLNHIHLALGRAS